MSTIHTQFVRDMTKAFEEGLAFTSDSEIEQYERRYGDVRPAVRVDDRVALQEVIRATPVEVDWDTLGTGFIVYPAAREGVV